MARKKKVLDPLSDEAVAALGGRVLTEAEVDALIAGPPLPSAVVLGPGDDPIEVPPGDPRTWDIEAWLAGSGIAVTGVRNAIDKALEQFPGGIPLKVLKRIWNEHTTPVQVEQALMAVMIGLANTVQAGKGPSGHAGAELA